MSYDDEYRRSIEQPEAFWAEQALAIHWHKSPQTILEYTNPPFRKWFASGETNLCYNAVDRHLEQPHFEYSEHLSRRLRGSLC